MVEAAAAVPPSPSAAPLPGVLILTTTPPLHIPSLLLSSHIRHPLKQQYPQLVASQWSAYLAKRSLQPSPQRADPVVWLKDLPCFPPQGSYDDEDTETDVSEDSHGDDEGSSDQGSDDAEDDEGNIWRGSSTKPNRIGGSPAARANNDDDKGTALANLTVGQVTYLAPIPPGGNPLLSLSFLHHLHTVIAQYFPNAAASTSVISTSQSLPSIPASTLTANFDVLYQILQEMLDDGRPLTTEYNSIKEIVRGKQWWEEITSKMASFTNSQPAPPPQISPLPWRNTQVRHTRNEIYVDIVEQLTCTMDRKGKLVGALPPALNVSIGCKAKLSGTPDLTLALHPSPIGEGSRVLAPAFHPCVRHRRWVREGVLSFVPPEGDFQLASMAMDHVREGSFASKGGSSSSTGADLLPFTVKASRSVVKDTKGRECTFEIRLTSKTARMSGTGPSSSEALEVTFAVGAGQISSLSSSSGIADEADMADGLGSISVDARAAVSSSANSMSSRGGGSVSASGGEEAGSWTYDARQGLVKWTVPRLGTSTGGPGEVTLKGKVTAATSSVLASSLSSSVLTTFSLPAGSSSLSGLRVASLQVGGVDYKPFKGVRGATRGRVEWRW